MNKKAQELDIRNIMQGLEEFATFMSFQGNSSGLRILSVESAQPAISKVIAQQKAPILSMKQHQAKANDHRLQTLKKSLSFQDRMVQ